MQARSRWISVLVFAALIAAGLVGRLVPHPPNYSPLASLVLFAGFFFERRWVAACVPLAAMAVSDLFLGGYPPLTMATVYLTLLFPLAASRWIHARRSPVRVGLAAVANSVVFFTATNLAVWRFESWYAHTAEGLIECFAAAVPFFRNTLASDLTWSLILFGGHAVALALTERFQARGSRAEHLAATSS